MRYRSLTFPRPPGETILEWAQLFLAECQEKDAIREARGR